MAEKPSFQKNRIKIENHVKEYNELHPEEIITIPIVFHILYASDEEKISVKQLQAQLDALNRDFSGQSPSNVPEEIQVKFQEHEAHDTGIRFCLAKINPNTSASSAINWVKNDGKPWSSGNELKSIENGGSSPVSPEKFLNIWIGKLENGTAGFAQMPGGPHNKDGVVMDYRFLPSTTLNQNESKFENGKTLTHLIGSYLNLFELWGKVPCLDDKVSDTPRHNAPNFGCPEYVHMSTCQGESLEMTMNFMDNTNDACMYMFTKGQKRRMRAILSEEGWRAGLKSSTSSCSDFNDPITLTAAEQGQISARPSLVIYPNPASEVVQLHLNSPIDGQATIKVYNAQGQLALAMNELIVAGDQSFVWSIQNWSPGLHILKIQIGEFELDSKLMITKP